MMLAAGGYATIAILILVVAALAGAMLVLAHVIGPKRHGPIKESPYESGMAPLTDARRRFNVRFYLVAVMYVVFSVEVVFLYPWAVVFAQLPGGVREYAAAKATGRLAELPTVAERGGTLLAVDAGRLAEAGYGPGFMLVAILVFFALLGVGFVYEWRKGVFRWD